MSVEGRALSVTAAPAPGTPPSNAAASPGPDGRISCATTTAPGPARTSRTSTNAAPVARATDSSNWSGTTPRTSYALKIAATSAMPGPYPADVTSCMSGLLEPARVLAVVDLRQLPRAARGRPAGRVRDDLLALGLGVRRDLLAARREVEAPALAAAVAAAGAEPPTAAERADEHQLVRLRDVEQL